MREVVLPNTSCTDLEEIEISFARLEAKQTIRLTSKSIVQNCGHTAFLAIVSNNTV